MDTRLFFKLNNADGNSVKEREPGRADARDFP